MSTIPKYVLKRMFPADCVKKTSQGLEISLLNILSPGQIVGIPKDPKEIWEAIEIKVDSQPLAEQIKRNITLTLNEITIPIGEMHKFEGQDFPMGAILKVFAPLTILNSGEEHEVEFIVHTKNPIHIQMKRTIQ
jgi:hypothetical protein